MIHQQHCNCHSSGLGQRFQLWPIPNKVLRPLVLSWVEESNNSFSFWINARYIRSLKAIAMNTSEGQILKFTFASVLPCDNMIYLEGAGWNAADN